MNKLNIHLGGKHLQKRHCAVFPLMVSETDLLSQGIRPRKLTRVMAELQKAVDADPALNDHDVLLKLAGQIDHCLL